MFEKNRMIHPERKRKTLHGNYAQIDPHTEIASAFINQAISQVEGTIDGVPYTGIEDVCRARSWVNENKK